MSKPVMVYVCPECRLREDTRDALNRHLLRVHGLDFWATGTIFATNAGWEDDIDELANDTRAPWPFH